MHRRCTTVLVCLSMLGVTAGAPSAARADNRERVPIIILDLASDAAIIGSEQSFYPGLVGYLIGGPFVHAVNGNWTRVSQSLGVRVAAPILGGVIGCAVDGGMGSDQDTDGPQFPECFVGLLVGIAAGMSAQVFDAVVLSSGSDSTTPRMLTLGTTF
jgi:hypothetical protein